MRIKLSFLGAAGNVTGSRFLLEANGTRVLIDCGLYQERDLRSRNFEPFVTAPGSIDAVLLTHAHLDHCGLLPKLARDGFKGKIYCTGATAQIAEIVMLDCGHLQEEDAAYKLKRHKREGRVGPHPVVALYTADDAAACVHLFSPVPYDRPTPIADGIEVTFRDAGHILGASMIKVKVSDNGEERTILFSGDIGRPNKPILRDPTLFDQADYVVIESTYGDRVHQPTEEIADTFAEIINSTRRAGGNVIIPSFALERSQEVLYHLNELLLEKQIPPLMVFMDSPMAIRVTEVFENHPEVFDREMLELIRRKESPFDFSGLTMTRTTKQSKAINNITGTVIIIAGSGMCTGGRVKHHLVSNISRPESTILFVGYQAVGTLGRRILDGADEVRIIGHVRSVKARVARMNGFSGHADRDELFAWLSAIKQPPKQLFIVHGEPDAALNFSEYVENKVGWKTSVPNYKDTVNLD